MWTSEHRKAVHQAGLRYGSGLRDEEWSLAAPLIPLAKRGGRKREVNMREVVNAIFHILWTGCQWKALPKDFPPKSTVHWYLMLWSWDGTLERPHGASYVALRERKGHNASPRAAIIDSQSTKAPPKRGLPRPAGLRCGQESYGPQEIRPGRDVGFATELRRPSRQHPGLRWYQSSTY